jgi:hypothetical protein
MPKSIKRSPNYALYRDGVDATDSDFTDVDLGINTSYFKTALVQVVPSGGADPTVEVMWWSEEAESFVKEHVALTKAGIGANTPFEFSVSCYSRIMFVAVTITAGSVKILVAGAEINHPE